MNPRKSLIKLANSIESSWQAIDFNATDVSLNNGWYITEFIVQGSVVHTPRILLEGEDGKQVERQLIGYHSGRNRMLIYLPTSKVVAVSESIEFTTLARVPTWEGRARILLICFRYLLDFFSPLVLLKMIAMQFKNPFELSSDLLHFYTPPAEGVGYLRDIERWNRFKQYSKMLTWFYRGTKIAVLIQDESQREALTELMVVPDLILNANQADALPDEIDFVIPLAQSERLRSPAIVMLKRAIAKASRTRSSAIELVYTDHDYDFDEDVGEKIMQPVFKPEPSAAYLHCYNYIGPSVAYSRNAVSGLSLPELFDANTQYSLGVKLFKDTACVLHVADALFQSSSQQSLQTPAPDTEQSGWSDIKWQRSGSSNVLRAANKCSDYPSVDLIIPTRDGLAVLKPCVESILQLTEYPNYQVIIVDNGSELAETHQFFADITEDSRIKVVDYPGEFNFSAINNFAIAQGSSEYVAMVNNDIEVIHGDWLDQMMVWVKQPRVGIVGAKLLFSNGLVQHAGVTIGMGNAAGHIHRLEAGDSPGYQNRCIATQNMMAVTAACLVTPRALFEKLGGLDTIDFKVAYNDIDYCLRVEKMGLDIIWTPEAQLYHHESVSRGDDMSDQHIERYFYELGVLQKRWKTKGFVDKYYSRHLRIGDEGVYPQVTIKGTDKLRYL